MAKRYGGGTARCRLGTDRRGVGTRCRGPETEGDGVFSRRFGVGANGDHASKAQIRIRRGGVVAQGDGVVVGGFRYLAHRHGAATGCGRADAGGDGVDAGRAIVVVVGARRAVVVDAVVMGLRRLHLIDVDRVGAVDACGDIGDRVRARAAVVGGICARAAVGCRVPHEGVAEFAVYRHQLGDVGGVGGYRASGNTVQLTILAIRDVADRGRRQRAFRGADRGRLRRSCAGGNVPGDTFVGRCDGVGADSHPLHDARGRVQANRDGFVGQRRGARPYRRGGDALRFGEVTDRQGRGGGRSRQGTFADRDGVRALRFRTRADSQAADFRGVSLIADRCGALFARYGVIAEGAAGGLQRRRAIAIGRRAVARRSGERADRRGIDRRRVRVVARRHGVHGRGDRILTQRDRVLPQRIRLGANGHRTAGGGFRLVADGDHAGFKRIVGGAAGKRLIADRNRPFASGGSTRSCGDG
ncbi:hypothetical protein D9M68_463250 [compost metagenome]